MSLSSQREWEPSQLKVPSHQIGMVHSFVTPPPDIFDEAEIFDPESFDRRLTASLPGKSATSTPRGLSEVLTDLQGVPTFVTEDRRADVSPQSLADRWLIGLDQAQLTRRSGLGLYVKPSSRISRSSSTL
jgi:hypothetical protein